MKKQLVSLILTLGLVLCASAGLAGGTTIATAVIDGKTADRVHLRETASVEAKSLGLYFTGTEVIYDSGATGEWTSVVIGDQAGYIKSEYLYLGSDPSSVKSQQPSGVVTNVKANSWVNLRSGPHQKSTSVGTLYKDDVVTVLGETVTKWYYVNAGGTYGYVLADFLRVGGVSGNTGSKSNGSQNGSSTSPSKVTTIKSDPKDSTQAYITVNNCVLNIMPTDGTMLECTYDTSVLRIDQSMARGVHMLTIEGIGGKSVGGNAAATVYVPRATYNVMYVSVNNGETSIAGGIDCLYDITGFGARISANYPAGRKNDYLMRFTNTTCVLGISENTSDYTLDVQQISGGNINPAIAGMPTYQTGISSYKFTNGNGNTRITVEALINSTLEVVSTR